VSGYYIGLMSGTSMDAIDAALVAIDADRIELKATCTVALPAEVVTTAREINSGRSDSLAAACHLDKRYGSLFADAVLALLGQTGLEPDQITAIGCHGQTLLHCPWDDPPWTLQVGAAEVIAERTGISTITDFRSRDIAAGGQGAPLVPAFHRAMFSHPGRSLVILNIGGIANITHLPGNDTTISGFDTGPGNTLLDAWSEWSRGRPYDDHGDWAAGGQIITALLDALRDDDYFARIPPKSTGTEYFNLDWIASRFPSLASLDPRDVQATLAELGAVTVAAAIRDLRPSASAVYVCGGGAHNTDLLRRLRTHLGGTTVATTAALGLEPDWVEAVAFAWLAWCTVNHRPANLPEVTGARHSAILGRITPA